MIDSKYNHLMKKIIQRLPLHACASSYFYISGDILVVNTNWWQHSTSVHQDLSISITNEYDVNYL